MAETRWLCSERYRPVHRRPTERPQVERPGVPRRGRVRHRVRHLSGGRTHPVSQQPSRAPTPHPSNRGVQRPATGSSAPGSWGKPMGRTGNTSLISMKAGAADVGFRLHSEGFEKRTRVWHRCRCQRDEGDDALVPSRDATLTGSCGRAHVADMVLSEMGIQLVRLGQHRPEQLARDPLVVGNEQHRSTALSHELRLKDIKTGTKQTNNTCFQLGWLSNERSHFQRF